LNEWCEESFLEINVGKTKELVLDARKTKNVFVPVKVNNEPVELVSNFKYLGTLRCEQVLFVYVFTIIPPRLTDPCNFNTVLIVSRKPEQTTLLF